MKTAFYVAGDVGKWSIFNRIGLILIGPFQTFEAAMHRLNILTATHAEHRHCDDCGEGFVTGARDVLCPKCRPIRSNQS